MPSAAHTKITDMNLTAACVKFELVSFTEQPLSWMASRTVSSLWLHRTWGRSLETEHIPETHTSGNFVAPTKTAATSKVLLWRGQATSVEPPIMDTQKSGQPPHNGHTVRPLPLYFPTSEEGTTSEQWQNDRPQCVKYSEVPL